MKLKLLLLTVMAVSAWAMMPSGIALAQSPCDNTYFTVDPTFGRPGSSFGAGGIGMFPGSQVQLFWDTTAPGNLLGITNAGPGGVFYDSFNVPAAATDGVHQVIASGTLNNESPVECAADFTVYGSVQQDAYPSRTAAQETTPNTLPSTGLFLLVPVAGFAAAGLGAAILKRRR